MTSRFSYWTPEGQTEDMLNNALYVVESIEKDIASGKLTPGMRLSWPPLYTAQHLAYRSLARDGIITYHWWRGWRIK